MNPGATFTIVGDMMQGVNAARGLSSWDALAPVLDGPYDLRELITSYRSTVEIILLARRVWENCPSPVSTRIEPCCAMGTRPSWNEWATSRRACFSSWNGGSICPASL